MLNTTLLTNPFNWLIIAAMVFLPIAVFLAATCKLEQE